MNRTRITRWGFAAITALSLMFGSAQAFATVGPPDPYPYVCSYYNCRAECGTGCGGTCVNNECWCDC